MPTGKEIRRIYAHVHDALPSLDLRGKSPSVMGLSTSHILRAVAKEIRQMSPHLHGEYLDIGAGKGELIQLLRKEFDLAARACDYTPELMRLPEITVDVVDLDREPLPYHAETFDLVTCTEVIEHLENFRQVMREIFRTLKPGAILVVTTPNVLNLRSRIRYLFFGFFNLFGPLHLAGDDRHLTGGHIAPVASFYLIHALARTGFCRFSVSVDRKQRGSFACLILLWLPIRIFSRWAIHREKKRYHTMDAANELFVKQINSLDLLLGRTLVVGCRKP